MIWKILISKRFFGLFVCQFFGAFNDNAFKNALLFWLVYDYAQKQQTNVATLLAIATIVFILPFLLLSATAGQLADKYEKSQLTRKIKFVEIILMLFVGYFFFNESVIGLYLILFFMGAQSTFFGPIKYSLLAEYLHDNELVVGNAIIESSTFLAILLGTIFGGMLINVAHGKIWICSFLVLFAIVGYISSIFMPKVTTYGADIKINMNVFVASKEVISYAKADKTVWFCIIAISWFWFIGAVFLTQFPVYSKNVIAGDEKLVTFFLTIFSLGIGFGSMLCNKFLKGEISLKLVPFGCFGISLSIILFYIFSVYYHVADGVQITSILGFLRTNTGGYITLALFAMSISIGIYCVPLYAVMQHLSARELISRIIAGNNIINSLFMVLSGVFSILIFSLKFDVNSLFLLVGLLNLLVLYFVVRFLKGNSSC